MKTLIQFLLAAALLASTALAAEPKVRHMVCFKYKDGTTPEQIAQVRTAFLALKDKVPGIVSIEAGENTSPEKHNKGMTHCFLVTFQTAKDRDAYLPHPEHKAFGKLLGPVLDDVFVVDFAVAAE